MATNAQNRPFVITDDDKSGILVVVTVLCTIYSLGVLLVRVLANRKSFQLDDWLAVAATVRFVCYACPRSMALTAFQVFAVPQFLLVHQSAVAGLGKTYTISSLAANQKIGNVGEMDPCDIQMI